MPTTTTGLATSFITFSRPGASGGGATTTDRDGKIKWAGHNLLTNSESFDASAWSKAGGVTVAANTIAAPNGTTTADEISFTTTGSVIFRLTGNFPTVTLGATYTHGVWLRAKTGTFKLKISRTDTTTWTTATVSNEITLTTDWQLVTITYTVGAGDAGISDFIIGAESKTPYSLPATGSIYAWGAHLYRSDLGSMQLNPAMPAGMQSYYPTTPRNLLGFTEDFSNWTQTAATVTADSAIAPNGLQTADKIIATAASGYHARYRTAALGSARYTISVYAKAAEYSLLHIGEGNFGSFCAAFDLASGAVVAGSTGGSTYVSSAIANAGNGWWRCSIVISNPAVTVATNMIGYPAGATINLYGAQYTGDGTSGIYLWGAQLSDSASLDAYVPVYGAAVTSAAYYAPRLDFDPVTLAAKGLLVEEARTNLLTYSSEFSNAAWNKVLAGTNITVSADAAIAPDGANTADLAYPTASDTTSYTFQTPNATNTFAFSLYAKASGKSVIWLYLRSGSENGIAYFDLSNQTTQVVAGSVSTLTVSITPVGNGWFRISATTSASLAITGGSGVGFGICDAKGSSTITKNGTDGILVWGAQLEAGSFATSYIPTSSATATRGADVASVSTGAFPYSSSEGTWVVAFTPISAASDPGLIGDQTNSTAIAYGNATKVSTFNGTSGATSGNSFISGAVSKAAVAFDSTGRAVCLNGGTVVTASGTMQSVTRAEIGRVFTSTSMNGWVRQLTEIPRRLTSAELQSRTAA